MGEVTEPGASREQQLIEQFELHLRDSGKQWVLGVWGGGRWEVLHV